MSKNNSFGRVPWYSCIALLLAFCLTLSPLAWVIFSQKDDLFGKPTTPTPQITTPKETVATDPEETSSVEPEVTSTEPEVTSTEPEVTSTEPEVTSTEPEVTSTEPDDPITPPEPITELKLTTVNVTTGEDMTEIYAGAELMATCKRRVFPTPPTVSQFLSSLILLWEWTASKLRLL